MSKIPIKPQNFPETLVWYYIIGTYPIYFLGALYVSATFLASFLTFYLFKKWWNQNEGTTSEEKIRLSLSTCVWIIAILLIEFALLVGHLNFNIEIVQIIKSSLSWYRSWGLLALFILAGCLNIRPKLIYRAVCILCLQSLIMVIIGSLAGVLKIPNVFYVSPLKVFGGVITSYYINLFYIIDDGQVRLQLFAPWAPALGMLGNLYFCLALQELDKKWRWFGMAGAVAMTVASVSRLAILCLPFVLLFVWLLTNFFRPWVQLAASFVSVLLGILSTTLINFLVTFKEQFSKARSGSSEVRAALQRLALDFWQEAPIWGHGRMEERGPAIVAHLPIGSHHTWFGILYTHGLVGCVTVAIVLLWSFIDLAIAAQTYEHAKVGLSIILIIFLFTFAENVESFAYVYWPALLVLGIIFKEISLLQTFNK